MSTRLIRSDIWKYLVAVAAASAATGVIILLDHLVHIPNVTLLFIPVILISAVYFGVGPSLTCSVVAVLEYDFFLIQPLFTLTILKVEDVLALFVFVIVAVLTSQLAARARSRAQAAQRRAKESQTLYELGQALMSPTDVDEVLHAITRRVVDVFLVDRCAIFTPESDGISLQLAAETVLEGRRDRASEAAASWVFEQGTQVGLPDGEPGTPRQRVYVPLRTADRIMGVMEVGLKRSGEVLDADERRLVTSFAAQAALVIARAQAEEERHRLKVLEGSDRLKSALLSAVSHDLRTPLASIKASATALLLADAAWSQEEGRGFLETIDQEADRLNRLVGNLLDLSRIEAGALRPVLEWYSIDEVVATVTPRLRSALKQHPFSIEVEQGIPEVKLDLLRVEEVLVNLVENAAKYTPSGSPVEMRVSTDSDKLRLEVIDHGAGVAKEHRERVFDTFYRPQQHGDREHGSGLGLAICRGVAEAHGGLIELAETPGGGATFVLTLPQALEAVAV